MLDLTNLLNFFCQVALFDVKIFLFLLRNNYLSWAGPTRLFKNKITLRNNFLATNWIPIDLTSGVFYKFQCGFCNESYYGKCVRHLNVRIGEHIGISPLTKKQVKFKSSSVADHLLFFNHSASYDDFSILTRENKKFWLELKESLSIMRDKPSLNRNITSVLL